jgi:hypothetical protein
MTPGGISRVKASKAYIAGLGTTGILIASSVLLMLVVGALVAFNQFSASKNGRELEGLLVDRDQPPGLSGPALAAAEAAPAARGVSARPPASVAASLRSGATRAADGAAASSGASGGGTGSAGTTAPGGSGGGPAITGPQGGGGPSQQAGGGASTLATPSLPAPGTGGGHAVGQTTDGVTQGVGGAIDNVAPGLGGTVRRVGETTGGLLDGLTGGR